VDLCTYGTHRRADRAISSYDYIGRGESSEKVGGSIESAWIGTEAAFNESGHNRVWRSKGEWVDIKSDFL